MKKIVLVGLIVFFVLQLAFPLFFVFTHFDTLQTGDAYKFEVEPRDPYDPFRGRYVALETTLPLYSSEGIYGALEKDAEGYAVITQWTKDKPSTGEYIKNPVFDRYYMNEKMAPEAERIQRSLDFDDHRMYLLVNVKNGGYVIEGLYLDGVAIEEYIAEQESFE